MRKFLFIILLTTNVPSFAQDGRLDVNFNPQDQGYASGDGCDDRPTTCLIAGEKIYLSGYLDRYNGITSQSIARLHMNGKYDSSFQSPLSPGDHIYRMNIQADGKILASGIYDSANKTIWRMNQDGSLDTSYQVETNTEALISTIKPLTDGKILLAGGFTQVNGVAKNYLVRTLSDGSIDTSFQSGTGPNGALSGLKVLANAQMLIWGNFSHYNGEPRNYLARLNPNGSLDTAFQFSLNNYRVVSLDEQADGKIVALFFHIQEFAYQVGRLHANGTIDLSFPIGSGITNYGYETGISIKIDGNQQIYLCGRFKKYNDVAIKGLVRFHSDGSIDETFSACTYHQNTLYDCCFFDNNDILTVGDFKYMQGRSVNHICKFKTSGLLDTEFNPSYGANEEVTTILPLSNNKALIAGNFDLYNHQIIPGISVIDSNGNSDTSFVADLFQSNDMNEVSLIAAKKNGGFLLGGMQNNQSMPTETPFLVQLHQDGTIDTSFHATLDPIGKPSVSCFTSSGAIFLGLFNQTNTILVKLNEHGTNDDAFLPNQFFSGSVSKLLPLASGKIIAIGNFSHYQGTTRNGIARINLDGSLDFAYNPGGSLSGKVYTADILPNEQLIIGGRFTYSGSQSIKDIARIQSNGPFDLSFETGTGLSGSYYASIRSITIQPDGKILFGGDLVQEFNGHYTGNLGRLHPNGSVDVTFNGGSGPNQRVNDLCLHSDGSLLIGGNFTAYNDTGRNRIARIFAFDTTRTYNLEPLPPLLSIDQSDLNAIQVYPNPANSELVVEGINPLGKLGIYSSIGELIFSTQTYNSRVSINTSGIPSGNYILKISNRPGQSFNFQVVH